MPKSALIAVSLLSAASSVAAGRTSRALFAMACLVTAPTIAWSEVYPVLNSYAQPPFTFAGEFNRRGLGETLVQLVQTRLGSDVRLDLQKVPRRRLELLLEQRRFIGLALFLAPEFLAPQVADGAEWSVPVMVDENVVVTNVPRSFSSPQDFEGLRLGGISGHIYRVFGPQVEVGRIRREDAPDHVSNLKKLCLGRVDFLVMSRSEFAGSAPLAPCQQPYLSRSFPDPQVILRRVLVRTSNKVDAQRMLGAVSQAACSKEWTDALAPYGMVSTGCPRAASDSSAPADARAAGRSATMETTEP